MSKSYAEVLTEDRRLVLLKLLQESAGYKATIFVLQPLLDSFGHVASVDTIRTDLYWLQEQGLVKIEEIAGVVVATLTARGADVATGRAFVPGVKKPLPV